jgi:hypothetical protein
VRYQVTVTLGDDSRTKIFTATTEAEVVSQAFWDPTNRDIIRSGYVITPVELDPKKKYKVTAGNGDEVLIDAANEQDAVNLAIIENPNFAWSAIRPDIHNELNKTGTPSFISKIIVKEVVA